MILLLAFDSIFSYCSILSNSNGKRCLDVEGASTEDGGNIWSWEINNFDAQKFYLEEVIPSEERKYIKTTGEYSEDGRYLTSMKDQLGNESHFEYDSNRGLTLKEIDAKGNTTNYEYDSKTDNLQKITRQVGEKEYSNALEILEKCEIDTKKRSEELSLNDFKNITDMI